MIGFIETATQRSLILRLASIDCVIDGFVATTATELTYYNDNRTTSACDLIFTLPRYCSLVEGQLRYGERDVCLTDTFSGASGLHQDQPNRYCRTIHVQSIEPWSLLEVKLTVVQLLTFRSDSLVYRLPMFPLHLATGREATESVKAQVSVSVLLNDFVDEIRSPNHSVLFTDRSSVDGRCRIDVSLPISSGLNRSDFVLIIGLSAPKCMPTLMERPLSGRDTSRSLPFGATTLVSMLFSVEPLARHTPSEFIFVIDCCCSLQRVARRLKNSLIACIKSIPSDSYFNINCARTQLISFQTDSVKADDYFTQEATNFVRGVTFDGEACMLQAILSSLPRRRSSPDIPLNILFVTDGNIGDMDATIEFLTHETNFRLFVCGIECAPFEGHLETMASLTNGVALFSDATNLQRQESVAGDCEAFNSCLTRLLALTEHTEKGEFHSNHCNKIFGICRERYPGLLLKSEDLIFSIIWRQTVCWTLIEVCLHRLDEYQSRTVDRLRTMISLLKRAIVPVISNVNITWIPPKGYDVVFSTNNIPVIPEGESVPLFVGLQHRIEREKRYQQQLVHEFWIEDDGFDLTSTSKGIPNTSANMNGNPDSPSLNVHVSRPMEEQNSTACGPPKDSIRDGFGLDEDYCSGKDRSDFSDVFNFRQPSSQEVVFNPGSEQPNYVNSNTSIPCRRSVISVDGLLEESILNSKYSQAAGNFYRPPMLRLAFLSVSADSDMVSAPDTASSTDDVNAACSAIRVSDMLDGHFPSGSKEGAVTVELDNGYRKRGPSLSATDKVIPRPRVPPSLLDPFPIQPTDSMVTPTSAGPKIDSNDDECPSTERKTKHIDSAIANEIYLEDSTVGNISLAESSSDPAHGIILYSVYHRRKSERPISDFHPCFPTRHSSENDGFILETDDRSLSTYEAPTDSEMWSLERPAWSPATSFLEYVGQQGSRNINVHTVDQSNFALLCSILNSLVMTKMKCYMRDQFWSMSSFSSSMTASLELPASHQDCMLYQRRKDSIAPKYKQDKDSILCCHHRQLRSNTSQPSSTELPVLNGTLDSCRWRRRGRSTSNREPRLIARFKNFLSQYIQSASERNDPSAQSPDASAKNYENSLFGIATAKMADLGYAKEIVVRLGECAESTVSPALHQIFLSQLCCCATFEHNINQGFAGDSSCDDVAVASCRLRVLRRNDEEEHVISLRSSQDCSETSSIPPRLCGSSPEKASHRLTCWSSTDSFCCQSSVPEKSSSAPPYMNAWTDSAQLDPCTQLVELLAQDGFWKLTPALSSILGVQLEELILSNPWNAPRRDNGLFNFSAKSISQAECNKRWATSLAISWLRLHSACGHEDWELIDQKAERWFNVHAEDRQHSWKQAVEAATTLLYKRG